jgi:hypothetical protein
MAGAVEIRAAAPHSLPRGATIFGEQQATVAVLDTVYMSGTELMSFLNKLHKLLIIIPIVTFLPALAQTEEPSSATNFPCEQDARFSEFDFWVGAWDVHVANGKYVGSNVIERAQRGCVLIENWTSAAGGGGMSINYLDKITGEWVQVWNDASGSQIHIRGGLTDDGMFLQGTIHYVATGTTAAFRGLWTPLPDGRVRQFFEQSPDDGKTWSPWFEGFYSRKTADQSGQKEMF